MLADWAGWALNRRCTDTAPGATLNEAPHSRWTHKLGNTDGGESTVGGLQTPVSGPHNGAAGLANPTLSPTSELHKLKRHRRRQLLCRDFEQDFSL